MLLLPSRVSATDRARSRKQVNELVVRFHSQNLEDPMAERIGLSTREPALKCDRARQPIANRVAIFRPFPASANNDRLPSIGDAHSRLEASEWFYPRHHANVCGTERKDLAKVPARHAHGPAIWELRTKSIHQRPMPVERVVNGRLWMIVVSRIAEVRRICIRESHSNSPADFMARSLGSASASDRIETRDCAVARLI